MKKIYSITLILLLVGSFSCKEDFLTQAPIGNYDDKILYNAAGVKNLLVGAYSLMNGSGGMVTDPMQALFGSIRGGEAHKGSTTGDQPQMIEIQRAEATSGNSSVASHFQFFYNAIFRANLVLYTIPKATDLTAADKKQIIAEARFLRGHYHFMLKRLFKNIPYIDETSINSIETNNTSFDVTVPNTDESGAYVNAWPQILADFDAARTDLTATNADLGRPNSWAAQAYYAKTLLYMGNDGMDAATNYANALTVFNNVITSGVTNGGTPYALYPNYHWNFDVTKENGSEWVFGAQNSVGDGSSGNNSNGNQMIQYTAPQNTGGASTGPCSCTGYGFFNPSQWFVNHFRTDADGLPILDDATRNSASNGIRSNDSYLIAPSSFTPDPGNIDPRLDWAVGRAGIPYYDYGMFNVAWVRSQVDASPYISKKQFVYKSQSTFINGTVNALNSTVIRFADVLLMAAELEARTNTGDLGLAKVNLVRSRMVNNSTSADNWVKNTAGTGPAANYKIGLYTVPFASQAVALQAILMERTLELGLEGHRAYDLVRFGAADGGVTDKQKFQGYIDFESGLKGYLKGGSYSTTPDAIMPIPQQAIQNSFKGSGPSLKQNPNY